MSVYARGWVDTRENVQNILKADEFLSKLITRNAYIPLIKEDSVSIISSATQILCGARYLANDKPQRSQDYVKSLVIGELMSPVLPQAICLSEEPATDEFMKVVRYLMVNDTIYNRGRLFTQWVAEIHRMNQHLPDDEKLTVPRADDIGRDECQHYLLWLAHNLPKSQSMSGLQLLVTCYIGAAKRGTVSDRFLDKIIAGVKDDIGEDITLDTEVIHTTYVNFGRYITAENAKTVFNTWLEDVPEHALRIRLTLEQVSGSGLTAFLVCGRAIKRFATFPWGKLDKLTDGELTNYSEAVRIVNGNPYYGFNRDLKAAKSTNYSSIAYVAKELLLQISGEISLKNYQGWIKKPKSATIIIQMITDYVNKYNEDLMRMEITDSELQAQTALIEAAFLKTCCNLMEHIKALAELSGLGIKQIVIKFISILRTFITAMSEAQGSSSKDALDPRLLSQGVGHEASLQDVCKQAMELRKTMSTKLGHDKPRGTKRTGESSMVSEELLVKVDSILAIVQNLQSNQREIYNYVRAIAPKYSTVTTTGPVEHMETVSQLNEEPINEYLLKLTKKMSKK